MTNETMKLRTLIEKTSQSQSYTPRQDTLIDQPLF